MSRLMPQSRPLSLPVHSPKPRPSECEVKNRHTDGLSDRTDRQTTEQGGVKTNNSRMNRPKSESLSLDSKLGGVSRDMPGRVSKSGHKQVNKEGSPCVDIDKMSGKLKKAYSMIDPAKQMSVRDLIRKHESKANPPLSSPPPPAPLNRIFLGVQT